MGGAQSSSGRGRVVCLVEDKQRLFKRASSLVAARLCPKPETIGRGWIV